MITSINCRAFVMAASCLTWFITAALGSVAPKPRPLLMLSIFADIQSRICAGSDCERDCKGRVRSFLCRDVDRQQLFSMMPPVA